MKAWSNVLVAVTLMTATGIGAASPALASTCSGGRQFNKVYNESHRFTQAKGTNSSVTGESGVTLTISRTRTFTVGGSITSTHEISATGVILAIKKSLGVTVQGSRSTTSSTSGAWTVPKSYQIGRLAIGSIKYKGTVKHYVENKACRNVQVGKTALYNVPKKEWHFHHSKVR